MCSNSQEVNVHYFLYILFIYKFFILIFSLSLAKRFINERKIEYGLQHK